MTKRVISVALALISMVLICSCANKNGSVAPTPKPTPTATPQYLWTTEYTEVEKTSYSLSPLFYSGDGFYACGMEVVGENIPEEVINEAKKHKKEVVNDGRYNVYENRLCFVGMDGKVCALDEYHELDKSQNPENWKNFSSVTNIGALTVTDGSIYTLEYIYSSGNSKPDDEKDIVPGKNYNEFSNRWYLRQISASGEELFCIEINLDPSISILNNSMNCVDGDFVAISVCDGKNGIIRFTKNGDVIANTMTDNTLTSITRLKDGSIIASHEDGTSMTIYAYNTHDSCLSVLNVLESGKRLTCASGSADFFFDSGINFCAYDDGQIQALFNWSSVNVNPQKICSNIYMTSGYNCVFMTSDGNIVELQRINYDENAERKTLILATSEPSAVLLDAVAKFNQTHYDVKIEVENYLDYSGEVTGENGLKLYVYNHLGGQMPDIIDLNGLPYKQMAKSGMLEELYQYIDADVQLSKDGLFESILGTLEIDGKLYCTAAGFSIDTVIGQTNVVGQNIGWTYSDYFDALVSMGAGTDGFDSFTSKDEMLREVLSLDLDSYINWDEMTCNFTDGRFYNLLCYLNTFPKDIDYAKYSEQTMESSDLRIRNGRQMLQRQTIYGIDDALRAGYEFTGDTTFVGYPTEFGTGNSVDVFTFEGYGNLAMSSSCADKQAAWEFLRLFFSEEYQAKSDCFPTNINLFNKRIDEAMIWTPVLSKKGEQLYDDDGEPRYYEVGTMYLSDYTAVPYYPLTEEKTQQLLDLINSTVKVKNDNEDIYRIIKNAMDKDNACEIIQEEVTRYLNAMKNE